MNNFNIAVLPRKNFSDMAMSDDGRYITVVSYLDSDVCAESFLYNFGISDYNSFRYYSSFVTGSSDRRNKIRDNSVSAKNYLIEGNYFSDGSIFSSWDYGKTWTLNTQMKPKNWVSVDMSADGKIQTIVGRGLYKNIYDDDLIENTLTHIYISRDYGQSWFPKCSSRIWNGISISPDGSSLIASDTIPQRDFSSPGAPPILKNNILFSKNFGEGWEPIYKQTKISYLKSNDPAYYLSLTEDPAARSVSDPFFSYFGRKQSKLSISGQYQLIASPSHGILLNSSYSSDSGVAMNPARIDSTLIDIQYISGSIVTSSLDGVPVFSAASGTAGRLSRKFLPLSCDMSENGRYQIIAGQGFKNLSGVDEIKIRQSSGLIDGSQWLSDISGNDFVNNDVYLSSDFGVTWSGISSLPKGLLCLSVSMSDDAKHIGILGRPHSKKFFSPDGTGRYGSDKIYGPWANYKSGNTPGDNLIYYFSENSGASWSTQERRNINYGIHNKYTYYLSQKVLGNFPKSSKADYSYYFNFPENEYLTEFYNIDNWNSRVLVSKSGDRTAILDQGQLLLKGFPNQTYSNPTKDQISLNPGAKNWTELKTGDRFVNDISISNNGSCITYIVNSGNLYEELQNNNPNISPVLDYILYSGEYSNSLQHVGNYKINLTNGFRHGLIYTSRNSGISWTVYQTPSFPSFFNYKKENYGVIRPLISSCFPANISKLIMSEDGRYQTVLSDMFFASGAELISQPDADLKLYRRKLYSPIYRSQDSGVTWQSAFLETGPNGLFPTSVSSSADGSSQYFVGENYGEAIFKDLPVQQKFTRLDTYFLKQPSITPFARNTDPQLINYTLPGVSIYGSAVYKSTNYGLSWDKILSVSSGINISGDSSLTNIINSNYSGAVISRVPSSVYNQCRGVTGVNFRDTKLSSVDCSHNGSRLTVSAENILGGEDIAAEYNSLYINKIVNISNDSGIGREFDFSQDESVFVVGLPFTDNNKGRVVIYKRIASSWVRTFVLDGQLSLILNPPGSSGDALGSSVTISANGFRFAVSAPVYATSDQVGTYRTGRVKVYESVGDTWVQLGTDIIPPVLGSSFGTNIRFNKDGTRLFIHAVRGGSLGSNSPRIYVYKFDYVNTINWVLDSFIDLASPTISTGGFYMEIDDAGETLAISRPSFNTNSVVNGVVNVFNLNKKENKWEELSTAIPINNTKTVFASHNASIQLSQKGDKIVVFEDSNLKAYFRSNNSWVQLGKTISNKVNGIRLGGMNSEGDLIAYISTHENPSGKLYVHRYLNNEWIEIQYLNIEAIPGIKSLTSAKARLNASGDKLYLGLPNAGAIEEYVIYLKDFISQYRIECPYSQGRFLSQNFGSQWSYQENPLVDYYGFIPPGANLFQRKQSLKFKEIKIASNNTGIQIAIGDTRFGTSKDGSVMGGLYKNYKNTELSSIYLTRNDWSDYELVSSPGKYIETNISQNGDHISYLNAVDVYEYNKSHLISEAGSRYGIPYVSHNSGKSFNPILRWDSDIEFRKSCYVGNEWVEDEWCYSENNISGFLETPLIDRSYDIVGTYFNTKSGSTFLNSFSTKEERKILLPEYNEKINEINESILEGVLKVNYASKATLDHTNTALHKLSFSREGQFAICVSNGQKTTIQPLMEGSLETSVTVDIQDGTSFLNNKIYINDRYGDYEYSPSVYLNSGLQLTYFLPNSGKNISATNVKFNNPASSEGFLYKGDLEKRFFSFCSENRGVSEFSQFPNGQMIFLYTGKPAFVNLDLDITSTVKDFTSNMPINSNLFFSPGEAISSVDVIPGSALPAGITFSLTNKRFQGTPTQTGYFTYGVRPRYCNGAIVGPETYFNILSSTGFSPDNDLNAKAIFISFKESGDSLVTAKIKKANFTYPFDDTFESYNLSGVSGYGSTFLSPAPGSILTGQITGGYSGLFNLLSYQTGSLSGIISGDSSSATWRNVFVTGEGVAGNVYYDFITGYKNASNDIYINFNNISPGEAIILNESIYFTYNDDLGAISRQPAVFFNSMGKLLSDINLKAGGLVSGEVISSGHLRLHSRVSGSQGNSFKLERILNAPNSIYFGSRFFTGGFDFRDPAPFWSGGFSNLFSVITQENSGIYIQDFINEDSFGFVSGVVWDNSYAKNYTITTGLYSSSNPRPPSGRSLVYNSTGKKYEGSGVIPSGQSSAFTGLKFEIKRDKYNQSNNDKSLYLISGSDFIYSGIINL